MPERVSNIFSFLFLLLIGFLIGPHASMAAAKAQKVNGEAQIAALQMKVSSSVSRGNLADQELRLLSWRGRAIERPRLSRVSGSCCARSAAKV
jgi:hypothetical protein